MKCPECGGVRRRPYSPGSARPQWCLTCHGTGRVSFWRWARRLVGSIPRPMLQVGLRWPDGHTQWGYVVGSVRGAYAAAKDESDDTATGVVRMVWCSPIELERSGEFPGW